MLSGTYQKLEQAALQSKAKEESTSWLQWCQSKRTRQRSWPWAEHGQYAWDIKLLCSTGFIYWVWMVLIKWAYFILNSVAPLEDMPGLSRGIVLLENSDIYCWSHPETHSLAEYSHAGTSVWHCSDGTVCFCFSIPCYVIIRSTNIQLLLKTILFTAQ